MPSNTTNLDLYKVDPTTDGEMTFNIETMMNENWDKIDLNVAKKTEIPTIPTSLPANGGNSTTVNNHTAAATPNTTEQIDLVGMVNEVNNTVTSHKAEFMTLQNKVNNLQTNDITARDEIMDLKLKLKEQIVINFLNKTGVGFYDTFEDNSNIGVTNTTASYDSTNKLVQFTGSQTLKMKDETFDTFNNLELNLYPNKINKATIKGAVNNSASVITGVTDKVLTSGDKLFMNGVLNKIVSCTGNFTTNAVTDATVVASAYDTSGNGGRKLVRLSNGWLVCVVKTGDYFYFYKSIDGSTWTQLCYLYGTQLTTSNDIALVCKGTTVYAVLANGYQTIGSLKFDATTVVNTNIISSVNSIDTSQTAFNGISLTINEEGTELHACWSSKNATYSNSFNIRYAKGTINGDGSVTWGSVVQLSTNNSGGADNKNPTICVRADNNPVIIWDYNNGTSSNIINGKYFNGTAWNIIQPCIINGYVQSSPCAIFVPQSINGLANGRIWVTWHGYDSTNYTNIRVAYSDDGGVTWSTMQKLTSETAYNQMYPSITVNISGNITVVWSGRTASGQYQIRKIEQVNGVWGTITTITSNIANYPSTLFDLNLDYKEPLFIYQDTQNSKVGFYGTWTIGQGYTLTMQNPVTLTDGQQVPIADFSAQQNTIDLTLSSIDSEKFNFKGSNLNTATVKISIEGKNNKLNSMVYAIS